MNLTGTELLKKVEDCCRDGALPNYIASILFQKQWVDDKSVDDFFYVCINTNDTNSTMILDSDKKPFLSISDFNLINQMSCEDYLNDFTQLLNLTNKIEELIQVRYIKECQI